MHFLQVYLFAAVLSGVLNRRRPVPIGLFGKMRGHTGMARAYFSPVAVVPYRVPSVAPRPPPVWIRPGGKVRRPTGVGAIRVARRRAIVTRRLDHGTRETQTDMH